MIVLVKFSKTFTVTCSRKSNVLFTFIVKLLSSPINCCFDKNHNHIHLLGTMFPVPSSIQCVRLCESSYDHWQKNIQVYS